MNVLVLANMRPFQTNEIDDLSRQLVENLAKRGIAAERFCIPFPIDSPEQLLDSMAICRLLRLVNVDRVIALEFPIYHIPHPTKVVWISDHSHLCKPLFPEGSDPTSARSKEIKRLLVEADKSSFTASRRLFSASLHAAQQISQTSGFDSELLSPPFDDWSRTIERLLS